MYSNVVGQACQKCATGQYRRSSMTPELCEACGVGAYQNEEGQASWCVAFCFCCECDVVSLLSVLFNSQFVICCLDLISPPFFPLE